ncbi:hypothetical protein CTAYLR_003950 [Chrysophaeum taylorii]|uniref:MSP domain-containing protein n=1 Tax=Chrysophaeum taylorii TaxID=2483200 RepID=A0AAD7U9Z6_9STRA|nr:hypothetical protein CTAYLR_003950 [Chrysophaeum taylorii]
MAGGGGGGGGRRSAVEPAGVVFETVLPGLVYIQTISIRNTARESKRVRIEPPAPKGPFVLVYQPGKALAPGLDVLAEVHFHLPDDNNANSVVLEDQWASGVFRDRLVVRLGDGDATEVPLTAHMPHPSVSAIATRPVGGAHCVVEAVDARGTFVVRLGEVVLGSATRATIALANSGPIQGGFNMEWTTTVDGGNELTIEPSSGMLGADAAAYAALAASLQKLDADRDVVGALRKRAGPESASHQLNLELTLHAKVVGAARFRITTNLNQPHPPVLEVLARVVDQKLDFFGDETRTERLETIDFGALFFGQSRERNAVIVNDSPVAVPFVVSVAVDRALAVRAATAASSNGGVDEPEPAEDDDAAAAAAMTSPPPPPPSSPVPPPPSSGEDEPAIIEFLEEWMVDDGSLTVLPLEGLLEPYACQPVTFRFAPRKPARKSAFKHQLLDDIVGDGGKRRRVPSRPYGVRIHITVPHDRQQPSSKDSLEVTVTGQAAPCSAIALSPRTLRYGTCEVRSKHKALLTIENASDVPAKFEFAKLAHFSLQPARGKIYGNATTTVVVSYHPAQIGSFDAKCEFSVEGGLARSFLRLVGTAIQTTAAVCEQTSSRFVDGKGGTPARPLIQDLLPGQPSWLGTATPNASLIKRGGGAADRAQFDYEEQHHLELLEERARRDMNRTHYIQYLRRRRAGREAAALKAAEEKCVQLVGRNRADPTGVDLALAPLEEPPFPPLPDTSAEPLWMTKKGTKATAGRGAANAMLDPDTLIIDKFKPRPTTQAEMRHCETRLSAAELAQVIPSHATLDFGRVCIGSKIVRNFAVSNGLSHAILVSMSSSTLPPELIGSATTTSQVIPSETTAGFDVALSCDREAPEYRGVVQFTINDRHQLKLSVAAEVVPVELIPSCSEINVQFDPRSLEPSADAELILTNPGNCEVEFVWMAQSPFAVAPNQGTVPAHAALPTVVTWTPTPAFRNSCKLRLHVSGAKHDIELVATGTLEDGRCAFTEKRADFDTVAVGTQHETTVTIQSVGAGPAVCMLEVPSEASDFIVIQETRFIVPANGSRDVKLTFRPRAPRNLDGAFLACHVRGTKAVRLPLVGQAIVPDIKILAPLPRDMSVLPNKAGVSATEPAVAIATKEEEAEEKQAPLIDFASQFVGLEERRTIVLRNDSDIPAGLSLDMTKYQEFYVEPCVPTTLQAEEQPSQQPSSSDKSGAEVSIQNKKNNNNQGGSTMELSTDTDVLSSSPRGQRWTIRVAPKGTLSFELVFAPRCHGSHEFELPLELCESHSRAWGHVSGIALRPMLVASSSTIDFGERILVGDSTRQLPITQELTLTNQHHELLEWQIGEGLSDRATNMSVTSMTKIFYISPKTGRLVPGESVTVRITFAPLEAREYEDRLPLFFATEENANSNKPSLVVQLRGTGANPRLEVEDPNEHEGYVRGIGDVFVLPTVPLGIKSRVRFYVRNRGFESIQLKYRLPPHIPVKLEVDFPDGRALGVTTPRVTVLVSFSSDAPVSFSSAIQLLDTDGNVYMIPIAGAADNCVLSTYAFLDAYRKDYVFHTREGTPPRLVDAALARQLIDNELREKEAQRAARRRSRVGTNQQTSQGALSEDDKKPPADEAARGSQTNNKGNNKDEVEMGVDPNKPRPLAGDDVAPLLVLWLNYHALNSQKGAEHPMLKIPEDIIETHGRPAVDAIEALAGRKIPNRMVLKQHGNNNDSNSSDKELVTQLMAQYEALLLFLKERGALLNHVRAEQLLGRSHYVKVRERQAEHIHSKAARETRRTVWGNSHAQVSREAWLAVLLQSVRVFSLTRITPKTFASLPGVLLPKPPSTTRSTTKGRGGDGSDSSSGLSGSNVYSVGECILLKWLGYHISSGSGPGGQGLVRQLQTFADAFQDGTSLCYILLSHAPSLGAHAGPLDGCKSDTKPPPPDAPKKMRAAASESADALRLANAKRAARALCALRTDLLADVDTATIPGGGSLGEPAEVLALEGVRAMLFALHLYLTLPNFVPKTTIEYNATLGEPMCKMIELQNSAPREITYEVVMEGSTDFRARNSNNSEKQQQRLVVVEAKSSNGYGVELVPRFSKPVEARLTFFPIPGNYPGLRTPSMVFMLRSSVEQASPVQVVEVETTAYEQRSISIDVENPFETGGIFAVSLNNVVVEEYTPPRKPSGQKGGKQRTSAVAAAAPAAQKIAGNGGIGSTSKVAASTGPRCRGGMRGDGPPVVADGSDEARAIALLSEPFWTSQATLRLEGNPGTLMIQLVPLSPGVFKAEIRLLNEDIGEFGLEIRAKVATPKQTDQFKFTIEAPNDSQLTVAKVLRFPPTNSLLERALSALSERLPQTEQKPVRTALQCLARGVIASPPAAEGDEQANNNTNKPIRFEIHANSPYFRCADDIVIELDATRADTNTPKISPRQQQQTGKSSKKTEMLDAGDDTQQHDLGANHMLLNFYPHKAGTYQCSLLCRAKLCGIVDDMRALGFEVLVTTPKVQTILDFKAPARRSITQDLPILNSCEEDWNLVAQLSGSRLFSGPQKLRVPAGGRALYPLTFAPTWVSKNNQGKLVLRHVSRGENAASFEYLLNGEAEPPLSEGNEVIRCNARDTACCEFRVCNAAKEPKTYKVESDLTFVSGETEIKVPAQGHANYELRVTPFLGGVYAGSLTFTTASGEYVWYTVKVEVDSPLEERAINISTVVRQAASARISLANPLDEPVVFDVLLNGDGLIGEPKFTLESSQQLGTYELFYTPLIAQTHTGSVVFLNDKVGEFWYRLNLSATRAEPIRLDAMECAVGARAKAAVTVENPLDHEITLEGQTSNRTNFAVDADVTILPYASAEVHIYYAPSDLDVLQTGEITLHHPELGDWEYMASGRGTEPGVMNEHAPSAIVGEPSSYMFSFRNPFAEPLEVDVVLREVTDKRLVVNPNRPPLALLMRRTSRVPLVPHAAISIPLSFEPAVIAEHHAAVVVSGEYRGRRLVWTYPVRGVVNAPLQVRAVSIAAKAKTSTRHTIALTLAALAELEKEGETFDFEIDARKEIQAVVNKALTIVPVDTHLAHARAALKFEAIFEPRKPFTTSVNLVVKRRHTGGRWPFEIQLDAHNPEPDDVIHLEASLNGTNTVTFRLKNNTMDYAPFTAYFTTGSSDTFTISPATGVLPPANTAGTPFTVTFAPVKYGMLQQGTIVVVTDDMMWSYDVRGAHPTFVAPNATSKIDTHLNKKYLRVRSRRTDAS